MIHRRKLKNFIAVIMFLAIFMGCFYCNTESVLASTQTGIVTESGLNVRTGPGTSYLSIANLYKGDSITIISTAHDTSGAAWYKIAFTFGGITKNGYVYSACITTEKTTSDIVFETYLNNQGFPESYKVKLRQLHLVHPNWVFAAKNVGLNWSNVFSAESVLGKNLVPGSSVVSWKSLENIAYDWVNNRWQCYDGSWVAASKEITAYYLDPRNFLDDPSIFQFKSLSYSPANETEAGVENILSGTFMSNASYTFTGSNGIQQSMDYGSTFISAAEFSGASPYNLAVRVRQEQGVNGSPLAYGTVPGYEGYFNFFNIGSFTTSNHTALENGAIYASKMIQPWTSPYSSIRGGALKIATDYISRGQDTLYLQKFDVVDGGNGYYIHQYMTNVFAADSEASSMSNAYSSTLKNTALVFNIPVYTNMPATAIAKPIGTGIIEPMGITLNKTSAVIYPGNAITLTASVLPTIATNKNVSWSTSNANAATVDQTGKVTAVGDGTAIITATTAAGSKTAKCEINVQIPGLSVGYRTHVQNIGWQDYVNDGALSGTTGKSLRLEGINIRVLGNSNLGIKYATHVQNIGWQNYVSNGALSGTTGKSFRLEAIKLELTGLDAEKYDIYYRVHAQNYGWLDWAKNGKAAGTEGLSKRLEAIEIRIVTKGTNLGMSTTRPFVSKYGIGKVFYKTHVQDYGWQNYVVDGILSGTQGMAKRLEAINIKLSTDMPSGSVVYSTHVQNYGWMKPVTDGALSGTTGESKRLEAIKISLTGEISNQYEVYYRVHVQNIGWLDWAKNGQSAGTAGYSYRLEGIQIKLVPKGGAAPGNTTKTFMQK